MLPSIHPDLPDVVVHFVNDQYALLLLNDFVSADADCAIVDDQQGWSIWDTVLERIEFLSRPKVAVNAIFRFSRIVIVEPALFRPWRSRRTFVLDPSVQLLKESGLLARSRVDSRRSIHDAPYTRDIRLAIRQARRRLHFGRQLLVYGDLGAQRAG